METITEPQPATAGATGKLTGRMRGLQPGYNPGKNGKRVSPLNQALALQYFAYEVGIALRERVKKRSGKIKFTHDKQGRIKEAPALAQVIRAYEIATNQVRLARGKPLPGSLKPVAAKPQKRAPAFRPTPQARPEIPSQLVVEPTPATEAA